jgi:formamidopyrimidine-DNA glycosylase
MIELPEATVISREINDTLSGKQIRNVIAAKSPHKLAWYHKDPRDYQDLLANKIIRYAVNQGGHIQIKVEVATILFSEGIRLRYYLEGESVPDKHQMLIEFSDNTTLVASIQMYGGLVAFPDGAYDNEYYRAAREKPSPLTDKFDYPYFEQLMNENTLKLSLKGLLATEQRIPGLGNGVLQDILFNAKMHPRKKVSTLNDEDKKTLYNAIKSTLTSMTEKGGRDTEQDIFGYPGGYKTLLCKNTVNQPCLVCGSVIQKQAYMGGSIYFCEGCQLM